MTLVAKLLAVGRGEWVEHQSASSLMDTYKATHQHF